jgi:uncharacterized protein (DUF1330 family)
MTDTSADSHSTRYEIIVGMTIDDEASYQRYRNGMTPILESMGGFFRYDMRVGELIQGDADDPFNRIFILSFPDEATSARFFDEPSYKAVRTKHYDGAVRSHLVIASYSIAL